MAHVRTQIRNAIRDDVTGLATTGPRVLTTRNEQRLVAQEQLPALLVYFESGSSEESTYDADGYLQREVRVVVKGLVREAEDAEDLLNQIAAEVETAVTRKLGGIVIDCIPTETRFVWPEESADQEFGGIEIVFSALYRTDINAPEVSI